MCRLYGFVANEATKVDCSLVFSQNALMQQSRMDQSGRDHADGWGIVAYKDGRPIVDKKSTAAYSDFRFSAAAERIYSTAIVAHVRRATVGSNSVFNSHPFVSGRWSFAHNGTLTGFDRIRSRLENETCRHLQSQRKGETDSEQYFFWLLSRLSRKGLIEDLDSIARDEVVGVIEDSVSQLSKLCEDAAPGKTPRLNFVLTDGAILIACRWNNSLHIVQRNGIYDCEICGIPHIHHHETVNHCAVAIASEPVTHEVWQEMKNRKLVLFNPTGSHRTA